LQPTVPPTVPPLSSNLARRLSSQLPYRQRADCGYHADPECQPQPRKPPDDRRSAPLHGARQREFASHDAVNHTEKEYVRYSNEVTNETRPDGKPRIETTNITTNTVEGYYSIFKRGMKGIYQHCSEKHLHGYLSEFDFRYSNRIAAGVDDQARAEKVVTGATGKRLK
jgi:hypothetical protein